MNSFYLIQLFSNLGFVVSGLFIPLFAEELKATKFDIGLIVCAYNTALFLSSYIFGRLSDLYGKKPVIIVGLFFASLIFGAHIFIADIKTMIFFRILAGLAAGVFPAALATLMFETGNAIGTFAALGSLGWAGGALLAGVLKNYNVLFLISSSVFVLSFISSLFLKDNEERVKGKFISFAVIRKNYREYLSFLLRHTGAMSVWTIYPLFLHSLGADKFWIGIIYSVNPLLQFVFMQVVDKFHSKMMIYVGLILTIATFSIYAFCTNHYQVLIAQVVLALAWSFLYLGELKHMLSKHVERATAVGTFNSIIGLAGILGPIIGGALSHFGFKAVMLNAAGMALLGLLVLKTK